MYMPDGVRALTDLAAAPADRLTRTIYNIAGFSPRKQNLTVYLMDGFEGRDALMATLGKHTTGKSCLYFKRLSDLDRAVLKKLVAGSFKATKARFAHK